jgi:hypothetical protein
LRQTVPVAPFRTPNHRHYVGQIAALARHFGRSPDLLGGDDVRVYQLHLLARRVSWSSFNQAVCALRLLFRTTLARPEQKRLPWENPRVDYHDEEPPRVEYP